MLNIAVLGYAHPFGEGQGYGAEREIWYLIQELRKMGHRCVVFSVKGCVLPGFEFVEMPKQWDDVGDIYFEVVKEYERSHDLKFDIVQSYQASGKITHEWKTAYNYCLEPFFGFHHWDDNIIAYSHKINQGHGDVLTVIHLGVPEDLYTEPDYAYDDYLCWIGRMDHGKSPDIAIDVAKRVGKRIILMGPAYHYPYFVDRIWPHIDGDRVIWLRGVDDEIKRSVFRKALVFINPLWNSFHEMLGIVNIESLACGCPIIGWGNRQQPSAINLDGCGEIIEHGVHGFINQHTGYGDEERERSIDQAVQYIKQLDSIDRRLCYARYKEEFTSRRMAERHVKYYELLRERKKLFNVTAELG